MNLPYDVSRCKGVTEVNAALPIRLCATCARWQQRKTGGPRTPSMWPTAVIVGTDDDVRITCNSRIEGAL